MLSRWIIFSILIPLAPLLFVALMARISTYWCKWGDRPGRMLFKLLLGDGGLLIFAVVLVASAFGDYFYAGALSPTNMMAPAIFGVSLLFIVGGLLLTGMVSWDRLKLIEPPMWSEINIAWVSSAVTVISVLVAGTIILSVPPAADQQAKGKASTREMPESEHDIPGGEV